MMSGRAAGVRTAAALWGPFGREHLEGAAPDFWLETPADLPRMLLTLSSSTDLSACVRRVQLLHGERLLHEPGARRAWCRR